MKNRVGLIVIGAISLGIVAVVGWYLASPLFINRVVEEDFSAQIPSAEELAQIPDKVMAEPMPETVANNQPVLVSQGQFKDADSFHKGSGQAGVYQLPDGSHVLRFEDFSATNGPDLHVLLSSHPTPSSSSEVMENYLDLGSLKGNIGSQNYAIPAGTDVSQYKSVVIYCMPFRVVFATATLTANP